MKNSLTQSQKMTILFSGVAESLTVMPLTFMRLIDINLALGGKDLSEVLQKPTPYDLATIAYCLLDEESKEKIKDVEIEIDGKFEKTNNIHKLFCMMCENNITDGLTNYTMVLQAIVDQVQNSTVQAEPSKKKVLARTWRWILTRFMTK
jgi:hypothetical protein